MRRNGTRTENKKRKRGEEEESNNGTVGWIVSDILINGGSVDIRQKSSFDVNDILQAGIAIILTAFLGMRLIG